MGKANFIQPISSLPSYLLASFYTKYDAAHFLINTASLLSVLLPKLPQFHGVRLFGINKYWGMELGTLEQRAVTSLLFLYCLLYLESLRTMFPKLPVETQLPQIFIGKWGSLGPALLGAGFFDWGKTGEVSGKSLSRAGSHVGAAFWLIKFFHIIHSHHLPSSSVLLCIFLIIKISIFRYGYSLVSRKGREMYS